MAIVTNNSIRKLIRELKSFVFTILINFILFFFLIFQQFSIWMKLPTMTNIHGERIRLLKPAQDRHDVFELLKFTTMMDIHTCFTLWTLCKNVYFTCWLVDMMFLNYYVICVNDDTFRTWFFLTQLNYHNYVHFGHEYRLDSVRVSKQ